jgi:cis-3-alkyl-4-acyloxetan-2-one decarboxylase
MISANEEIWRCEYPFASRYFSLGHHKLHYVSNAEPSTFHDADQIVLCIHGNPTWSFYYRSILRQLTGRTTAIAVDHLGCGLSDKPLRYDYCLSTHTDNLIAFITGLDLRHITLVVHDWGGAIGLSAAAAVRDRIDKLFILNTGAFPPPYVPLRIAACRIPLIGSWAMRYGNLFALAATRMAIDRLDRLSDAARTGLLFPYDSPANRIGIERFVQDIPLTSQHRTYEVLRATERNLDVFRETPTRFVWGAKDWCFRMECLDRLEGSLKNSRRRVLSDVGHYVMEEAPDEVFEELQKLLAS